MTGTLVHHFPQPFTVSTYSTLPTITDMDTDGDTDMPQYTLFQTVPSHLCAKLQFVGHSSEAGPMQTQATVLACLSRALPILQTNTQGCTGAARVLSIAFKYSAVVEARTLGPNTTSLYVETKRDYRDLTTSQKPIIWLQDSSA